MVHEATIVELAKAVKETWATREKAERVESEEENKVE